MTKLQHLFTAALLASAVHTASASSPVSFDWLEYTGRDASQAAPLPAGHFRNPILSGFYPDPSLCRVGDDYYLINSTFSYYPGIPIFHSRDLVNWKQLGHVIDRPTQLNFEGLGITRGNFAPTISHHAGVFYVVCTLVGGGGNFLVTATNPSGPWSDPVWLSFDGIDPSLFFDDDGRAWMVNNGNPPDNKPLYDGHRAIWIQEYDIAARKMTGPRSIIINGGVDLAQKPVWIEGPHLYKRDGWYYLCCAEGGTSVHHSQVIFRSRKPTGPFVPWDKNPILTQRDLDGRVPGAVTCTGHADLVEGPDGSWWSVFLACRPFAGDRFTTGRETFLLPVSWTEDGWPRILPAGERVPAVVKSPNGVDVAPGFLNGNFTWRDEFDQPVLKHEWLMVRNPRETWWQVNTEAGRLELKPRAATLGGNGNPSFLARRIQHACFDVVTRLTPPADKGVSAGLAALQSETQYFYLAVRRTDQGLELFLECAHAKRVQQVARQLLTEDGELRLKIRADENRVSFLYASGTGDWQSLVTDLDIEPLTVQAAGGGIHFTGAVAGPHVRSEP